MYSFQLAAMWAVYECNSDSLALESTFILHGRSSKYLTSSHFFKNKNKCPNQPHLNKWACMLFQKKILLTGCSFFLVHSKNSDKTTYPTKWIVFFSWNHSNAWERFTILLCLGLYGYRIGSRISFSPATSISTRDLQFNRWILLMGRRRKRRRFSSSDLISQKPSEDDIAGWKLKCILKSHFFFRSYME